MIRARVIAICCGYEDADDLDFLRSGVQARLRAPSGHGFGAMFAANPVAAGECARPERRISPDLRALVDQWMVMFTVRDAIPKPRDLATVEFATLRVRLLKIAARVVEMVSCVRLAFAAACPEADLFRGLPGALASLGP